MIARGRTAPHAQMVFAKSIIVVKFLIRIADASIRSVEMCSFWAPSVVMMRQTSNGRFATFRLHVNYSASQNEQDGRLFVRDRQIFELFTERFSEKLSVCLR